MIRERIRKHAIMVTVSQEKATIYMLKKKKSGLLWLEAGNVQHIQTGCLLSEECSGRRADWYLAVLIREAFGVG